MAGEAVMSAAKRRGVHILPVDSEHNAIFQCLEERDPAHVRRLLLTASGGPFRKAKPEDLAGVTVAQALKHPTWNMGRKITIDSATLFNKGLEMIEARWLFGVAMDRVDVVVHPQSIVHSMVEFVDNSVLAQLSHSDMCFPIQYAVTWPDRVPNNLEPLDFAKLASLHFEAPRVDVFPALRLAREAGETGGTLPAVMNAANEVAVEGFLNGRIGFPAIWETVERVMHRHEVRQHPSLEELAEADRWARAEAAP
jgi:1-deoxy-D-xylulose-5-phosphate reductoisomerase